MYQHNQAGVVPHAAVAGGGATTLAYTGFSTLGMVVTAMVLLFAGIALLRLTRRAKKA